ncbi:MAG TPA: flotillin-like FloA family protein [Pirellulaceae bacterium]|nr:flotillin-like FloA family protein [Pirellulaceae bacterium]HMO94186.1 flotillin-like FloA family protein [Pirellulaceae bacterium]HMP71193.1 flotillin-like FloA family protein [Pirellulaceae bacterium]
MLIANMELGPKIIILVGLIFGLGVLIIFLVIFLRMATIFVKCMLSGAPLPFVRILAMLLRRSPINSIVQNRIVAAHAGVDLSWDQLERAALQGVDIERATLTLISAKQNSAAVTWEDIVETDLAERATNRRQVQ